MNPNILKHYRGNEELVKRCFDWLLQSKRRSQSIITPFLTPDKQEIVYQILHKECELCFWGGYEDAMMKRCVLQGTHDDTRIVLLHDTYDEAYASLNHRDLLGALMHAGIERERFGDLYVKDGHLYVFADEQIADFIISQVTKVKRLHINFKIIDEIPEFVVEIEWRDVTCASLRSDVIISACANVSRKKAQDLIRAGFVKINQVVLEETSRICNNNSTVSIRGYGRFLIRDTGRRTRKDNLVIEIGTYR